MLFEIECKDSTFFSYLQISARKTTFLCEKRARTCIYQKKIVILQRKMCGAKK